MIPTVLHRLFRSFLAAVALLAAGSFLAPTQARAQTPDTLEVFILYVQFKDETEVDNEAGTTGLGTFGSETKESYTLDPNGAVRRSSYYLTKRFELVQDYFDKVSGGQVVIIPRIFPAPEPGTGLVSVFPTYTLDNRMKFYNPALEDKSAKQKTSDFAEQRAIALMKFVSESARKHNDASSDSGINPFKTAFLEAAANPSPNKHRAFLIYHAGHSRLVDGGTLGYLGADTPNDFTDFFVTKPDFQFLGDPSNSDALRKDSLGVVVNGGNDTVSQFMMLSESASQDGINWGINGILINQLARQMGMPDLFDVVKGISQVGTFDVMDFAGYNTMQGFLPVFPSAWVRTFMGWDEPVVARPADAGVGTYSEYKVHAADQPGPGRIRSLKIPINEREYLLVENRQRAGRDTAVTVWFSRTDGETDYKFTKDSSVTVPYAFLDSLFLDSLCRGSGSNPCAGTGKVPNPHRPKGIITRASHYDMGLPGNGLLVWHVNEWFIESFLPFGAVNAYLGDTLRSQYKGLELVEADGVPSIGKEFTDALGQPAFDYGTARDMLPHVYRKRKNPPKDTSWAAPETLTVVGSYGFANTNSWNDGRTHITLEALMPANPVLAPGVSSFSGDSVLTVRDSAITVRVHWASNNTVRRPEASHWPVRTAAAGNAQAVSVLRDNSSSGRRAYVVSAGDSGLAQTYTAAGRLALAARDTVRDPGSYDSVTVLLSSANTRPDNAAPVNSFFDPAGAVLGTAVAADSVLAVLTPQGLRLARARADSLNAGWDTTLTPRLRGGVDTSIAFAGKAGPMVWGGRVFALDSAGQLRWWNVSPAGSGAGTAALPGGATADWHSLAGLKFGTGADSLQVIVAGKSGRAARVNPSASTAVDLAAAWGASTVWTHDSTERFSATVSDFDRDGHDDALLLGSRGAALLIYARADKAGQAFMGWPQRLARSEAFSDTLGVYFSEDRTPPALTDLDRDGHPDIVFSGVNGVYALDWSGAILRGWPFRMQPRQLVGFAYANRNMPASVIGSTPLAVSLRGSPAVVVASPDGLIYAVDSAGKAVRYSSFLPAQANGSGVLMSDRADWPLSVGGLTLDSNRVPFVHISLARLDSGTSGAGDLNLIAQTATGSLNVWSLYEAQAAAANWPMPGGDAGRSQRLNASALPMPAALTPAESIEEFHLYPSPLRGGVAKIHLKLGTQATSARIRVYDLSGRAVKDVTLQGLNTGVQPVRELDLRHLGPDVYSVLCEVSFAGSKKSKWQRLGVVK